MVSKLSPRYPGISARREPSLHAASHSSTALPDRLLEPIQETLHRHSVVDVDVPHPFDLLGVLDGFAQRHGRVPFKDGPFDGIGLQEMVEVVIEGGRINGNARDDAVLHLARKGKGDVVVRKDGDAVVTELPERIPSVGIGLASLGHEPFDGVAGSSGPRRPDRLRGG